MPAPILTTGSTVMCPHGGRVVLITSNTVARIQGQPALLVTDMHPVVGCPFTIGLKYSPCVTVRWSVGATQAKVQEIAALLQTSVGICYNAEQVPQGPPIVTQVQTVAQAL